MPAEPLLAIDMPLLLYRAFFALPESIRGADGEPVNALLGAVNAIVVQIEQHGPRAVAPCFGQEQAAYRVALYPPYHAHRPAMPAALARQWAQAPMLLAAFGWAVHDDARLEADDVLAGLAVAEHRAGGRTLILTGDRDLLQAVDDATTVLLVRPRGGEPEAIGPAEVRARHGVDAALIPDLIALRGDPSDGLPGGRGIGERTARDLLARHGTLEQVLAHADQERPRLAETLREAHDELLAFKQIATLQPPHLERPPDASSDWASGARAARELGLRRLAERCERLAARR